MNNDKLHAALRDATLSKTGADPDELDAELAAAQKQGDDTNQDK
jgi:hypothetical protein